jgi:hypothetical protein
VAWELRWWPAADEAMNRIDAVDDQRRRAVRRTLTRLEVNPLDPRLGTRQFRTPEYGHIRATPCRHESWYVLWQIGEEAETVEIVIVAEIPV